MAANIIHWEGRARTTKSDGYRQILMGPSPRIEDQELDAAPVERDQADVACTRVTFHVVCWDRIPPLVRSGSMYSTLGCWRNCVIRVGVGRSDAMTVGCRLNS